MSRRTLSAILFLLYCLAWSIPAGADEVRLRNGDRLTGKVVKMDGGILKVTTDYGGEIKIDWSQVESLKTDQPMVIQLPEKEGPVLEEEERRITVTEVGTPGAMRLSEVEAINPPPTFRYKGTVNIGGNSTRGNTQTEAVNASTRWMVRYHRHRLNLEAKYNYGEADGEVTAQNSLANVRYDYFLSRKVFLKGRTLLEKDSFQNLQLRTTYGSGVGYQFVDTARLTLAAEVGAGYVNEDFRAGPTTRTATAQWGIQVEFQALSERVRVFHKHEGFRDFGGRRAVRILADQGIRISLNKHLYVNLEYDFRLNTEPATGRKTTDEAFIFGVGFEWE